MLGIWLFRDRWRQTAADRAVSVQHNGYANPNRYAHRDTDEYAHRDTNTDADSYGYGYADSYGDTKSYGYTDSDGYRNRDTYSYRQRHPDPQTCDGSAVEHLDSVKCANRRKRADRRLYRHRSG